MVKGFRSLGETKNPALVALHANLAHRGTLMNPVILCVGEAIIDFHSQEHCDLKDATTFLKTLGGAPANLAIGLSRLGVKSGFIGAVGEDPFGRFVIQQLQHEGVDIRGIQTKAGRRTRLAFIGHDKNGDPDFTFWEESPADTFLARIDIPWELVADARILHLSSFLLQSPAMADLALWLAKHAATYGTMVSFDPNLRIKLWPTRQRARSMLRRMTKHVSIFRGNLKEGQFITGARSPEAAIEALMAIGPSLVVLTDGDKGCYYGTRRAKGFVTGFKVKVVDGTGCGDGFTAALLAEVARLGKDLTQLQQEDLAAICEKANAVGALVATKSGAASAMPTARAVDRFLTLEG